MPCLDAACLDAACLGLAVFCPLVYALCFMLWPQLHTGSWVQSRCVFCVCVYYDLVRFLSVCVSTLLEQKCYLELKGSLTVPIGKHFEEPLLVPSRIFL